MLDTYNITLCWKALSRHGLTYQMYMMIEEAAELIKAICKVRRDDGHVTDQHDEDFREELVDTIVMAEQMRLMLKMDMDEVNRRAKAKLERALQDG